MSDSSFGKIFKVTIFGESHGPAIGVVIDGCPAGLALNLKHLTQEMQRRKPGQSKITTARKEEDTFEILSGVFEGQTTGTPLAAIIRNQDQRGHDYEHLKNSYRPSHADFTYHKKYGIRDYRGGGRSSARETAARVFAGAIAKQFLSQLGIKITAFVASVGDIQSSPKNFKLSKIESTPVRCPDLEAAQKMIKLIEDVKAQGDTIGGTVKCLITGVPVGLGSPVFDKLHAELAHAMMSINATKGFEYGSGFQGTTKRGSEHNDIFIKDAKTKIMKTKTNFSGGIQGGLSNGMPIDFSVAFKPVATLMQAQETVNARGKKTTLQGKGRHDPCVLPRAVPIVEAMSAIVLLDHFLRNRLVKWKTS
jgi:chorismate synthase